MNRGACAVSPRARRSSPMAMRTTTSLMAVSGQTASSKVSFVTSRSGWVTRYCSTSKALGGKAIGCVPRQRQALSGSRRKSAKRHWKEDIHNLLCSHLGSATTLGVSKHIIPQLSGASMGTPPEILLKPYSIFTRLLRHLYDFPPPVCHPPQCQGGRRLSRHTPDGRSALRSHSLPRPPCQPLRQRRAVGCGEDCIYKNVASAWRRPTGCWVYHDTQSRHAWRT